MELSINNIRTESVNHLTKIIISSTRSRESEGRETNEEHEYKRPKQRTQQGNGQKSKRDKAAMAA